MPVKSHLRNMPAAKANSPAPCYYRFDVPPMLEKGPIDVELHAANAVWCCTIPYSRWNRRGKQRSISFAADKDGMPLKAAQFSNDKVPGKKKRGQARRGYIPYPGFVKKEKQYADHG